MPLQVVLDPNSENETDHGALEITDEVSFLKNLDAADILFIRGRFLCEWASNVALARGWRVDWRSAPSSELRQACPELTETQSKTFIARFSNLQTFARPIAPLDLVVSRWPEIDPAGKSPAEQAWSWLDWRARTDLDPDEQVVATSLAKSLFSQEPGLGGLGSDDKEDAWRKIKRWLRCEPAAIELSQFAPVSTSAWIIARLKQEWKLSAIRSNGKFFLDLVNLGSPRFILREAATVLCAYCRQNVEHLTPELLAAVKPFAEFAEWTALRNLLPAEDPGAPPATLPEVLSWFSEQYLKFRLKGGSSTEHANRIRDLGREFGLWYLGFYANARTGGEGRDLMSWSKTAQLASDSQSVKLLVVLDGLGYIDAKQVTDFIAVECSRLALDDFELVFAPLPTVTHFAKPALMAGVNPLQAFEEKEIGAVEKRDPDVVRALNVAAAGQVVIWSILEPDMTYHKPLDEQTTRFEVEGRLRSIARRLSRIISEVDDRQKLSLILTTDHGRLLSASRRIHEVPDNMQAHGRAAWGQASVPFNEDGIFVNGELAYIDPERFGIPESAAIVLSDDSFRTSDGRTGLQYFAHGGIFPEEVLIPWVKLTRDRGPLDPGIRLTGSGLGGSVGKIILDVSNTSEVRIQIVQIQLSFVDSPIRTEVNVGPLGKSSTHWTIPNWPRKADLPNIHASVVFALPTGEREVFHVVPEFGVDEMYSRGTALDDLL